MDYNFFSIISSKLKDNQIKSICLLKDEQWKFGIKSQMKWYRKNIKKNDIHNFEENSANSKHGMPMHKLLKYEQCNSIIPRRIQATNRSSYGSGPTVC